MLSERSFPNGSCAPLLCPVGAFTLPALLQSAYQRGAVPRAPTCFCAAVSSSWICSNSTFHCEVGVAQGGVRIITFWRLSPSFVGKIIPISVPPSGNWEWAFLLRLSAALIRLSFCCWRWVRNTLPWATVITRAL